MKSQLAIVLVAMALGAVDARAQEESSGPAATGRRAIKMNRWQEDWSALRDPALRTEPLDGLK